MKLSEKPRLIPLLGWALLGMVFVLGATFQTIWVGKFYGDGANLTNVTSTSVSTNTAALIATNDPWGFPLSNKVSVVVTGGFVTATTNAELMTITSPNPTNNDTVVSNGVYGLFNGGTNTIAGYARTLSAADTNNDTVVSNGVYGLFNAGTNTIAGYARTIGDGATNQDLKTSNTLWLKITNYYAAPSTGMTIATNVNGQDVVFTFTSSAGGSGTGIQTNSGTGTNNIFTAPILQGAIGSVDSNILYVVYGITNWVFRTNGDLVNLGSGKIFSLMSGSADTNAAGSGVAFLDDLNSASNTAYAYARTIGAAATNQDLKTSNTLWLDITNVYIAPGANVTVTTNVSGQSALYTIASAGGGGGSTYYVATNGSTSNTGLSTNSPWPLLYAVTNAGAWNNIVLLPGVYSNTVTLGSPSTQSGLHFSSLVPQSAHLIGASSLQTFIVAAGVTNVTIEGLEIGPSYIDCVKLYASTNCIIRNCWIHDAAHGNPSWVTNVNASFVGNGILAEFSQNLLVENCLVENNGAEYTFDQGVYVSGTNGIIRNNVIRRSMAVNLQIADSTAGSQSVGWQVYNNLIYGSYQNIDNGEQGVLFYGAISGGGATPTNYLFGNTIISTNATQAVLCEYGCQLMMTNNIVLNGYSGAVLAQLGSAAVFADYNITTNTFGSTGVTAGSHQIVSTFSALGFDNPGIGLWWINPFSSARGASLTSCFGPVDFWGDRQSSINHIGAFPLKSDLVGDYRTLDPYPTNGSTGYWVHPSISQSNYISGGSMYSPSINGGALARLADTNFVNSATNDVLATAKTYTNETTLRAYVTNLDQTILAPATATNTMPLYGGFFRIILSTPGAITNLTGITAGVYSSAIYETSNSLATTLTNYIQVNAIPMGSAATNSAVVLGLNGYVIAAHKVIRCLIDYSGQTNWMIMSQ